MARRRRRSGPKPIPVAPTREALLHDLLEHAVVFDLETTGFSHKEHEIIQLAGLRIHHGQVRELEVFDEYIRPAGLIPDEISHLTGIHDHHVRGASPAFEVIRAFTHFVGDAVLVAHNGHSFDVRFMKAACNPRASFGRQLRPVEYFDSLQYARACYGNVRGVPLRVENLCEMLGVEGKGRRHSAIGDVNRLAHCLVKLADGIGRQLEAKAKVRSILLPAGSSIVAPL
jgi:DNA polymerase III alpha subunit (gram-positive type)